MRGVLVDTCVWSLALRDSPPKDSAIATQMAELIDSLQVKIIGAIRQEALSGCKGRGMFDKLQQKLARFPNEAVVDMDYECAAQYSNLCRAKGIQGSNTDFLICAVAVRLKLKIFTTDKDFQRYAKHLPLTLLKKN